MPSGLQSFFGCRREESARIYSIHYTSARETASNGKIARRGTTLPPSWPTKQTLRTPKCLTGQYFEPTERLEPSHILKQILTVYMNAIMIIPRPTHNSITPQLRSHTFAPNSFSQTFLLAEPFWLRKITRNQTSLLTKTQCVQMRGTQNL